MAPTAVDEPRLSGASSLDGEPRRFGSGWGTGIAGVWLGAMSLGGVLCFLFPEQLTTPAIRQAVPVPWLRALLATALMASFVLSGISLILRRRKLLGAIGFSLALVALMLGGSTVPVRAVEPSESIGLDWLLLNLVFLGLLFIPLELAFGRLRQSVFRPGWRTDLAHFFVNHLLIDWLILLTVLPARVLFSWNVNSPVQEAVQSLPFVVQLLGVVVVADVTEYWVHRAMHQVPLLWRFHSVHHSVRHMDWLAGSRLHLADTVGMRAAIFIPLYVLGFSSLAIFAYLTIVAFHAVFIHANVRFRLAGIDRFVVTPRFHHWHHSAQVTDKNFALHLPVLDRLFGTHHLPASWPEAYGIEGSPVPEGYVRQIAYPFRAREPTQEKH